jgi:glycyl-tRNA synthetase (class II)
MNPLCLGCVSLRSLQMGEEKKAQPMSLGEAVEKGIIANETLAYFIGRTWLFFIKVGVNPERMRFRQHLQHEVGRVPRVASLVRPLGGVLH